MSETTRTRVGGAYEILAELGEGGMAHVFKARHREMGRLVALKVLPAHLLADQEARAHFEQEARAGAQLEHDHIVTTFDFGVHEGSPYLAVAFIEGETLEDRIRRQGRLAPREAVRLLAPIAEAVAYAHRQGVIHRDVKSSNIMIRAEDERPLLIDFGIAQASFTQKLTRRGDAMGTPEYMSPEQASAQEIDARSDLYSLGVVLYECLTGTVPFKSPHAEVVLANIKYEAPVPVGERAPGVPAWLVSVVDRCLAKQPEDRFEDGEALARALRTGLAATPGVAPPRKNQHVPRPRLRTGKRTSTYAAWITGALLLLGVVGYSLGWLDGLRPGPAPQPGEPVDEPAADLVVRATTAYEAAQYQTAFPLFLAAANSGSAAAQYFLGEMFHKGQGVPLSNTVAASWYQKAADQDHVEAQYLLGRMYALGEGVRRNDARAAAWYRRAAEKDHTGAQNNLGVLYESGTGVVRDDSTAAAWFRLAATQGLPAAQANLGRLYESGKGIPQDDAHAVAWYRKAAEQGYARAQTSLGWMYERGRGVAQNNAEAVRWYARAADQGDDRARQALERLTPTP